MAILARCKLINALCFSNPCKIAAAGMHAKAVGSADWHCWHPKTLPALVLLPVVSARKVPGHRKSLILWLKLQARRQKNAWRLAAVMSSPTLTDQGNQLQALNRAGLN